MCQVDTAAVAAAIADLTATYPHVTQGDLPHPALAGCDDVAWSSIPGCPEGVPVVLRGLLDPDAASGAAWVLSLLVMSDPLHISPVMPAVVPFLLRLAVDPAVPGRGELFDLVLVAAALSEATDPADPRALALSGPEEDHPERSQCRKAFAANATWVSRLLAESELTDDEHASLLKAAGL